jgi:excisionase family DNA binding protein
MFKAHRKEVKPRGYRVAQVCDLLQVSRSKVYKMMKANQLEYADVAGLRIIPADVIDALLTTRERPPVTVRPPSSPASPSLRVGRGSDPPD